MGLASLKFFSLPDLLLILALMFSGRVLITAAGDLTACLYKLANHLVFEGMVFSGVNIELYIQKLHFFHIDYRL